MRKLGGSLIFHKWKEKKIGWELQGTYRGTRIDQYGHINYLIADDKGQMHNLNHCGTLARDMKMANEGDLLLIRYTGQVAGKTKFGFRDDIHQTELFLLNDEERSPSEFEDDDGDEESLEELEDLGDFDLEEDEGDDDEDDLKDLK